MYSDWQEREQEKKERSFNELVGSLSMAAYALLLLSIAGSAILCSGASVLGLVMGAKGANELLGSTEVNGLTLARLRAQGVLGENESPLLFHDHSSALDGSAGCMVIGQDLLSWKDDKLLLRLPIPNATVTTTGPADAPTVLMRQAGQEGELSCSFGADEGGERFLAMLMRTAEGP